MNKLLFSIFALFVSSNIYGLVMSSFPFAVGFRQAFIQTFLFGLFYNKEDWPNTEALLPTDIFFFGSFLGCICCVFIMLMGVILPLVLIAEKK